jgi:YesN/AraC family two-component response regulator
MLKAIIVDGDSFIGDSLENVMSLEERGFKVMGKVKNGKDALAFIEACPVDVIINDISMPIILKRRDTISNICYDMISGELDFERYLDCANLLSVLDNQYFRVVSILWNNYYQSVLSLQMSRIAECAYCLCSLQDKLGVSDVFLSLGQDRKVICMRADTRGALEKNSSKIVHSIEATLRKNFAQKYSIGVGKIYKGFLKLQQSYFESIYALSFVHNELDNKTSYFDKLRAPATLNGKSGVISQAKEYIQKNYMKANLTLTDVATHVHLHPSYFSVLFFKSESMRFIDYLTRLRLEKAKHLLQNKNSKTTQISLQVGYQNPTYFSTLFKKHVGVSPSGFRKKD